MRANLISSESGTASSCIGSGDTALDTFSTWAPTAVPIAIGKNLGGDLKNYVFSPFYNWLKTKITGKAAEKVTQADAKQTVKDTSSKINFAGAAAITIGINEVRAEVGSTAHLISKEDIDVLAQQTDTWQSDVEADGITTEGDATSSGSGGSTAAVGAAISVMVLVNNVETLIDDGAQLDASRNTNFNASLDYPFIAATTLSSLLQGGMGNLASTVYSDLASYNLNIPSQLFNTWVRSQAMSSKAGASKVAVAGSIDFIFDNSTANVLVGNHVSINQNPTYQSDAQSVSLLSQITGDFVDMAGNFNLSLQPDLVPDQKLQSLKDYFKGLPKTAYSPFGSSGGKNGVGGSLLVNIMLNTCEAEVGDFSLIHIGKNGNLSINAETNIVNFSMVQSGAQAEGGFAVDGAISFVGFFNSTLARLADTVQVSSGTGGTGGSTTIKASDDTFNINLVGSIAMGTNAGVGISLPINVMVRTVDALVGNLSDGALGPWQVNFVESTNAGPISMEAIPAFDGSGTVTTIRDGGVDTQEVQDLDTNATTGSFSLSYNGATSTGLAYNASAQQIQDALNALATVQADGGVSVSGDNVDGWQVTFNTIGAKYAIVAAPVMGSLLATVQTDGNGTHKEDPDHYEQRQG